MKNTYLFLFFIILYNSAFAQIPNQNITSLANKTYSDHLNDIWGYVDSTGIEYALVGTVSGVSIVSLANPTNPTEVLFITGDHSIWRDIKTWNHKAYITADQGNDGLLIIDLSPLPNATPTYQYWRPALTINNTTDTFNKAHNLYIDEQGLCYIAGSNIHSGEVFLLDVNTPTGLPIFQNAVAAHYSHDAYARGDTLWTSDINDGVFSVYDVSSPSSPSILARQATPLNFCHNAWISDDNQTLFTSDEKTNAWIGSFDVSDLSNIQEIDRWKTPNDDVIPHNIHVQNDYLVISHYTDGIVILDGSRPSNLVEVGRFDTYHGSPSTGFHGAWGAYPYLPSGLILVSDINTGLHILQPHYQRAAWLEGTVSHQNTGNPLFDVSVQINQTATSNQSNLLGQYKTGLSQTGRYNVTFSKSGFVPQTIAINFTSGQVSHQNIQLIPAVAFQLQGQIVDSLHPSQGIAYAPILLQSPLYNHSLTADSNGYFSLQIKNDEFELITGQWGHHSKKTLINALDSNNLNPNLKIKLRRGYKDEFVLNLGWTVSGNATSGHWERAIAEDIYSWRGAILPANPDIVGDIGDYCMITGNNGNGQQGIDDVDNGATIIQSPPIDLALSVDPIVSFYYYLNKPYPFNTDDSIVLYMSNGSDTAILWSNIDAQYNWSSKQEIRIDKYIKLTNNMTAYFKVNDDGAADNIEAAIDIFEIRDSLSTVAVQATPSPTQTLWAYPNPFTHQIGISYQSNTANPPLIVSNIIGQIIEQKVLPNPKGIIYLGQSWSQGVYFVKIGKQLIRVVKG